MKKQELHPRTAIINKKQKNQAKKARTDALLWLATTFPAAFDNEVSIRPLKIGIMQDVLLQAGNAEASGISKSKLREAVVLFTRRIDYLTCLKAREMRVDLQGHATVPVTEEEANNASLKIKKRVEKSVKNARKVLGAKGGGYSTTRASGQSTLSAGQPNPVLHSERTPAYYGGSHANNAPTPRSSSVVVKHKTTRAYDPDAVARLKEKLGLSLKKESVE